MIALLLSAALAAEPAAGPPADAVLRSTRTDRSTVVWWELGDTRAPTVMLVHGLPTSKELWVDVAPRLAASFHVVVVDLPDFGDSSDIDPASLVHKDRARALDAVREDVGVDTFALVAHDLGSSVAVDYMGLFGEHVDRLVLMSSPVYPDFEEPGVVDLVRVRCVGRPLLLVAQRALYQQTLRKGLVNDETLTDYQVRAWLDDYRGRDGRRRIWQNLRWGTPEVMFADYPGILREITAPTLLLQGARDPFIPMDHAERLDRDIPDSRLVVIEDGGHFLPMDTPERVSGELLAFLGDGAAD